MLIPQKEEVISRSPELDLTLANFPSQTKRITLPRNAPIEAILITVQVTAKADLDGQVGYGLANILKRVTLNVNDGTGAYDAVYASGPALLQLADLENIGLDRSTRAAIQSGLHNSTQVTEDTGTPSGTLVRITYPIWCTHPLLQEWLRLRSAIPAHRHVQDPILTMDFAPAAEICSVADPFSAAELEVTVIRRDLPRAIDEQIVGSGGFIRWDVRETTYDLATSLTNAEKRFAIPSPGEYASLCVSMLKGDTILIPADLSANTTAGSETQWRLEAAGNAIRTWRNKTRVILNDYNNPRGLPHALNLVQSEAVTSLSNLGISGSTTWVTDKAIGGPQYFGGAMAAGLHVQDPAVFGFDFLGDNFSSASELGSCLNANFPSDSIKWEIVGNVTTPATQTSSYSITGRRYRDDITRWKRIPIVN